MAGHVPRRVLRKPTVHKCLLEGTPLFQSDDGGDIPIRKLTFYADKDAYFLWARGNDAAKTYENLIWDIQFISDVRTGKPPKDSKSKGDDDGADDLYLSLVYRLDGIVKLEFINLIAQSPEVADIFKKAVNALTSNMLHAHQAPEGFMRKHYLKIKLHANGKGEIPLKSINRLMMINYAPNNFLNQWLAQFRVVKESEDGKMKYVTVEDFTEDLFFKMVDQLLNSRTNDIDIVFSSLPTRPKKNILAQKDFWSFLNTQQRDPRLNEILHPITSKQTAGKIVAKYERGKSDRLSSKGLMEYLMSEENNILDIEHLNQTHDMGQPLNHYFINSSHNTYLNGHQLRSQSLTEMYIQCLLLGCRCVELDCWPENDAVIITHGGTFCTRVAFEEVVAAIAEFAFVTSEYPIILSIENHCRRHQHLMQHMANTFRAFFGDKLLSQPLEDYPLEPGQNLPPPERLKNKILIKDKLIKKKGESSAGFGTLTRGSSVTFEGIPERKPSADMGTENPLSPVSEEPTRSKQSDSILSDSEGNSTNLREDMISEEVNEDEDEVNCDKTDDEESKTDEKKEEANVEKDKSDIGADGTNSTEDKCKFKVNGGVETENSDNGGEESSTMEKSNSDSNGDDENSKMDSDSERKKKNGSKVRSSIDESDLFPVQRVAGPDGPDITTINVALIHQRPSEIEGITTGPLAEILNYTTGVSFEGFAVAEKANCHFNMSSFVEEKGLNHIRTKPKEFVKYNMRQLSRIYPQGARINSSNYMPIIYWNVGCQMVALNFQTSDLPMQTNTAKFEFNGNTGYLMKPWVMNREGASRGVFNPFVQSKLEDIVPAKLQVKIISGYFLTPSEKKTGCQVEVDLYGLPADTVRHKYWTKKVPGPHPFWNEDFFTFKRVLLPEMALLRIAVYDDDKEMIGMRTLPLNAIRPGFRHINLRDKHNSPLPLEMLFVQIKVEDWVPDEMEDLVAMLMDPISFANRALQEMSEGLDEKETEFTNIQSKKEKGKPKEDTDGGDATPKKKDPVNLKTSATFPRPSSASGGPKDPMSLLPPQLGSASGVTYNAASLPRKSAVAGTLKGLFDESFICLEVAKNRDAPEAIDQNSKVVLGHAEFKKLDKKHSQQKSAMVKRHEKDIRQMKEKLSKGKAKESELKKLEKANKLEVIDWNRSCSSERYEKKRMIIESAHKVQLRELREKVHNGDKMSLTKELTASMKKKKKEVASKENFRQSLQEIEDRTIEIGKKVRSEFERIHSAEISKLEASQRAAIQDLVKTQAKELDDLNEELAGIERESATLM